MNLFDNALLFAKETRIKLCEQSFLAFCLWYFGHYITHGFAPMHFGLMSQLENDSIEQMVEVIFRGSAKSSLVSTMFVCWNICYRKRRFIIVGSDVKDAAQTQMDTIIYELTENKRILADFGRLFHEEEKESKDPSKKRKTVGDFITTNDVRVLMRSVGMKVRGQRYNNIRPELAVMDDPESIESAESEVKRKKTETWIKNELIAGMSQTRMKVVVIGNWLHGDCIVARLCKDPAWKHMKIPIIIDEGKPTQRLAWPDRYAMTFKEARQRNHAMMAANGGKLEADRRVISIEGLIHKFGTYVFRREFMLEAISENEQIIKDYWVHWIDAQAIPRLDDMIIRLYVDPAVSEKDENDPTAWLVSAYDPRQKRLYFIEAHNERLSLENIKKQTHTIAEYYGGSVWRPRIEAVSAFDYLCQQLETDFNMMKVKRLNPKGRSKKTRLIASSVSYEKGQVYLVKGSPEMEELFEQLTKFGKTAHDDLADVATYSVEENLLNNKKSRIHKKK